SVSASPAPICSGSSTTVTNTGRTGTVVEWQYSVDNFTTTTNSIAGTAGLTCLTSNLTTPTSFRVVVQSGVCPEAITGAGTVSVDPTSVAGTVSASPSGVFKSNSNTVAVSGNVGAIQWQSSPDNSTFTNIPSATSSSYSTPPLLQN